MSDMTLKARLFGDDVSMGKTFKGAGQDAQKAGDHISLMGKMAGGLGGLAKVGLLGFGGAAVAAGGFMAAMGVKTAAANEQAMIGFTQMLGSGKKAQVFFQQLQAFAAATPFELPGLVDSARQLLGVGVRAKEVIPTLTAYGDAAGALGISQDGFNHIMLATTQAMAAGTLHAGDLLQMTEAGLPVWKLLSEALHKPVAELQKMSAKGQLVSKDVLPKLQKQMEKDYGGSMAKQSQTLNGLWSTLMDTMNQGMAKTLQPLIPLLKDGIGKASVFLAAVLPKVAAGLAMFVKWLIGSHPHLAAFAEGAKRVGSFIMTSVVPAIQRFGGWLTHDLWPALVKGYRTIMPGLRQALDIIKSAFKGTGKGGASFGDIIKTVGQFIVRNLIPFLAVLIKTWLPALATAWRVIIEVIKVVIRWYGLLYSTVGKVIVFILRGFANIAGGIAAFLRALGRIPGFGWARTAAGMMQNAANGANALANALSRVKANSTITITTYYKTHGNPNPLSTKGSGAGAKGYASGGSNLPAGWATVGEHGPEYMYVPGGSTILPHGRTPSAGGGQPLIVQMMVDGRVLHQSLVKLRHDRGVALGLG